MQIQRHDSKIRAPVKNAKDTLKRRFGSSITLTVGYWLEIYSTDILRSFLISITCNTAWNTDTKRKMKYVVKMSKYSEVVITEVGYFNALTRKIVRMMKLKINCTPPKIESGNIKLPSCLPLKMYIILNKV